MVEKAYNQHYFLYIHAENSRAAHDIDTKLWTYKDTTFIPHERIEAALTPCPHIQIGYLDSHTPYALRVKPNILLQCASSIFPQYLQFSRIITLVNQDPEIVYYCRKQYKQYQHLGLAPRYYDNPDLCVF